MVGLSDPAGLVRALRDCASLAGEDSQAARERLAGLLVQLADSWTNFELETVRECNRLAGLTLAGLFAVGEGESAWAGVEQLSQALREGRAASAYLIWRNAWAVGFASAIASSADAPQELQSSASELLRGSGVVGQPSGGVAAFEAGVVGALTRLAPMIVAGDSGAGGSSEAWKRWGDAAALVSERDPALRTRLALSAADALVRVDREATRDTTWQSSLSSALRNAEWAAGSQGRREVVRWFDDTTGVTSAALSAVTRWLLAEAPEAKLTTSMILEAGAGESQRAATREQLSRLWGLSSPRAVDRLSAAWREAFLEAVASEGSPALVRAGEAAQLNLAATLLWMGDGSGAERLMEEASRRSEEAFAGTSAGAGDAGAGDSPADGQWAVEALSARGNTGDTMRALNKLSTSGRRLGPIDAEALVEIAFVGSPSSVRDSARRLVEMRADDVWVVNAVLEQLTIAPRRLQLGRTVAIVADASLPPVRDSDWLPRARRALVERLLRMLSGQTDLASADRIAGLLAETYGAQLRAHGAAAPPGSEDPSVAARALGGELRGQASSMGGAREAALISRRLTGRRVVAVGRIQPFVAEQAGVAEALALLVSLERPSMSEEARSVIRRLADRTRDAESVELQILENERAIASLWSLRFGQEALP